MAVATDPTGKHITLGIADLRVAVSCDDPTLLVSLSERYRNFIDTRPAHLHARVHLAAQTRTAGRSDAQTEFVDGSLRFTSPAFFGAVGETLETAELRLGSDHPAEDVDYFLRTVYALLAFKAGGVLFHTAGIVRKQRGYLFFGPSGSGKTTVARLSSAYTVLNDDLVLLLPDDGGWAVHATPFWRPSQHPPSSPCSAPLTAMLRLRKDQRVYLERMDKSVALAELMGSVPVIPADPGRGHELLRRGELLLEAVPVYKLHFRPNASFWAAIDQQIGASETPA